MQDSVFYGENHAQIPPAHVLMDESAAALRAVCALPSALSLGTIACSGAAGVGLSGGGLSGVGVGPGVGVGLGAGVGLSGFGMTDVDASSPFMAGESLYKLSQFSLHHLDGGDAFPLIFSFEEGPFVI